MKFTMQQIIEIARTEFPEISDFSTFEQCHEADEFIGYDEKSGAEYIATAYLKGYIRSWYAAELEDAGYWPECA